MDRSYDRADEDVGNIVALEHVNVRIPDQRLATLFYVTGLGLTRDPYLMTGVDNMWVNIGRSQFHLPTGEPQVLRGYVGLVLPSREALLRRLTAMRQPLAGTAFAVHEHDEFVAVTSPWGNSLHCYAPDERFGAVTLGMPYVEFAVPSGTVDAIVRFYRHMLAAPAYADEDDRGRYARVAVGPAQALLYRETERPIPPYDGHHLQIYVADFSGPHRRLLERGLVSEESDRHQYRFEQIVDPEGGRPVFTIEHEVRSLRHPLYARPLVNRDPARTNRNYAPFQEDWRWSAAEAW
jgi:catechol 2,3-dioxygenase-like lactoylglutathione lyase family enzyme